MKEVRTTKMRRRSRCCPQSSLGYTGSAGAPTQLRDRPSRAPHLRSLESEARRDGNTMRSNEPRPQKYTRGWS